MKRLFGPVAAAVSLIVLAPAATASAQAAPSAQTDDAAKLAEAHGIIQIMYPPATRQQMLDKVMADMTGPMRNLPLAGITDPGLKAIFRDYMDQTFGQMHAMVVRRLPDMIGAMTIAYAHQFTLAELKDIHTFALTPSGHDYFSHAATVLGDPAVKKVMVDLMADGQRLSQGSVGPFKDRLTAYVKSHPDAAKQLATLGSAQTKSN